MSVDFLTFIRYNWQIVTEDKSLMPIASALSLMMSIQQIVDYLEYQKDYQGKDTVDTREVIAQLNAVLEKYKMNDIAL